MSTGLLIARLVFGALIATHGAQKLFGWFGGYGLSGTGGFFEGLGFRPGRLFAMAAGLTEFVGGLLLLIGLFAPAGAAAIISVMIVAIGSVHWRNGLLATTNGVELPLLYGAAAMCLALTGPGAYSIDHAFGLTSWWTPRLTGIVVVLAIAGGFVPCGGQWRKRRGPSTGCHLVGCEQEVNVTNARTIVRRTSGSRHGPITRLMSPSDLGQVLKPFVFLDHFELHGAAGGTELHPHSGIATVTYLFEGTIGYEDSDGATGVVPAGGVEWFRAAHGAWHAGGPGDTGRARGFQLWLALPPDQELGAVENIYLSPDTVARDGLARVLVGTHGGATSPLNAGVSLNYLAVRLRAGELWRYQPSIDHTVGWVSVSTGRLRVPEAVDAGELAIFDSSNAAIEFTADADAEFVVGSAAPHPHDLVLGNYSVHTSAATLRAGEQRLGEIRRRLQNEGRL